MPTSQNGWKANERGLCTWYHIPGTNVELLLRKGPAGEALAEFARAFHKHVEPIRDPGCWSYASRTIRGSSSTLSNHASGTAIDLNAPRHPLGKRGTFTPAQRAQLRQLLNAAGGAIRWGGDYTGRADEMHFEVNTVWHAQLAKARDTLRRY